MSSPQPKHPNDMDWQELRDLVSTMSWMALDLGQHLAFTNEMLREELRPEAYLRAQHMAYEIGEVPYHGPREDAPRTPGIAVFDGKGAWSQ